MEKKLYRTHGAEAMFLGICGGLGKYFEIDSTIVRVAFALITFFSFGSLVVVYFILALIIPKEPGIQNPNSQPPAQ
ncbi:MAG: PspC domain-containing protein [Cytophagaceae bacterium]|nr:PspC domain-containing protein [Cytophagaceae bacterium]MBK9510484.1 PspC domain-containing protein [Cytophagaceae bacterium]MBK9934484.1 PspC domain-containing protein [Cytophagaceae bacterium]MBL0300931.1 PspC domain-containing protein [Cytophagaceae bacterium]MBL0323744.1 PspC domain-containing protein [Cytophagaceae bacterium]